MHQVSLSVIVATSGRSTLRHAVESATSQMKPGDQLIVQFDRSNDAGDTPRNRVLDNALGTHITFLDDDDEYRPGALEAIRSFARSNPNRIGIFRVNFGLWGAAWREDRKNLMDTATAMYVIPNVPGKVGRFGRGPGVPEGRVGDYRFIVETVALQGPPVWCETVIQEIRPERSARKRLRYRLRLRSRLRRNGAAAASLIPPHRVYREVERWGAEKLSEAGLDETLAGRSVQSDRARSPNS